MKIFAFSDLHRDVETTNQLLKASCGADVIVVAGDFSTQAVGAAETIDILAESVVPVIVVHGNHDDPALTQTLCLRTEILHYLHGTAVTLDGVTFFGLGGEIPPRNASAWNAAETEERAATLLDSCPRRAVVVTHTPPLGTADIQKNGKHEGSVAIRDMIFKKDPRLLLCGHIHHAWGTSGTLGSTLVYNLGPTENWFDV